MTPTLMIVLFTGFALGLLILLWMRKIVFHPRTLPVSTDWIRELSASRYRPMERLLDERDFDFLAAHPSATRRMLRHLRTQRRRIFRSYLRCLERDFNRVCTALEIVMLQSEQDRPDLSRMILRQRARFVFGLMRAQTMLTLHALGWSHVNVGGLIGAFDSVGGQLRHLVPATDAVTA